MTNEEILKTADSLLGGLDRQRKFLLRLALQEVPCRACGEHTSQFRAAGITVNEYTFGTPDHQFRCPNAECGIDLQMVVPFFPGPPWFWMPKRD